MTTVRVIGIGQPAAGDDGVGIAVLERLRQRRLPAGVDLVTAAEPSAIIPLLEGMTRVVLVDAVLGGRPGEVVRLAPEALAVAGLTPLSTHGVGVSDALALALALFPDTVARRIAIVGVCIARAAPHAPELSAPVAAAVPHAVAEVEKLLED